MMYNIPKYYRYVILFKGEIEDVEPIIKVSNLSELKSINKGRMHLFDEELLPILPAIEYCFHMPRIDLTHMIPIRRYWIRHMMFLMI